MRIIIISAIARNGVIGQSNGEMPWHVKEEFQHFKKTTLGSPILMGRKTFETLGKPLKGRLNIILTKNSGNKYPFEDVKIFNNLHEAYTFCEKEKNEKIFIIGGGEIYKQALNDANEMILSYMKFDAEGDVRFPDFDKNLWEIVSVENREKFDIYCYKKKNNG